jgi:transcriptional regulator with XRE-family HTH domain
MAREQASRVVTRERRIDPGRRLARRWLARIGEEFREARLGAGLTQRQVGAAAGISHAQVSRVELGLAPNVSFATLAVIAAILGLDLPLRAYVSGDPIRDAAQVALLSRLRALLPRHLTWRSEVPLAIPGDRRAWDGEVGGDGWRLPVDAETRLRDVQALARRSALKRRDDGDPTVLLVVADTRHNRSVLRLAAADLAAAYPLPGATALSALRAGVAPTASAIVLL